MGSAIQLAKRRSVDGIWETVDCVRLGAQLRNWVMLGVINPATPLHAIGTQRLVNVLQAAHSLSEPHRLRMSSAAVLNANIRLSTRSVCRVYVPRAAPMHM